MEKQHSFISTCKQEGGHLCGCLLGAAVYALGVNLFVVPSSFYNSGVMGFCQVIRTLLVEYLNLPFRQFDIAGLIYYLVNIPILLLAFTRIGRKFFIRTLLTVTAMSVFLVIIPVTPVLNDRLTASVIGGILAGTGAGIALRMGASDGGASIIGMLVLRRKQGFSVGKMMLIINLALYAVCLFLFQVETVIYSLIYAAVYAIVLDRVHIQTINVSVMIVTKVDPAEMERAILEELGRGVTKWTAEGGYTNGTSYVLNTIISKYELHHLHVIMHRYDPHAFVVINEGVQVQGNYRTKL